MNNKSYLLAVVFCAVSKLQADAPQNTDQLKTSVELSQGYRRDNLTTKISRHNLDSSYSAKGKYKGVDTYTTRLSMTASKNDFFLKGMAGYGNVYGGKNHEKSTFHGIRTVDSQLTSHVKGDYTADLNLAFGKDFFLANDWKVSPSIGYGVYVQDFHTHLAKGHYKTSSRYNSQRDKLRGSEKSRLKAIWYSPQFGLSVQKALTNTLSAYANYTFLFPLSYTAKGHDKYRNESYRYERENKAYKSLGNIGTVGLNWNFAEGWSLKPEVEVMKFFSKGGDSSHKYNLKKVTRSAAEYRLVVSYLF
ncbi:MAG: hypothetical protein LLF94_09245 [Chlamydiales bacterium]|nr:hypothetical protein [Chlamydiales bacterium]